MAQDSRTMDWNDTIQDDGQEFIILPEGDYTFTVKGFERRHYEGSAKLPPCPMARVTLEIDSEQGVATAITDIKLCRTLEFRISDFFRSIGQKKQGETVKMDWDKVVGARGKAHIRPRKYKDRNGNERIANEVVRFIPCGDPNGLVEAKADDDLPWNNGGF